MPAAIVSAALIGLCLVGVSAVEAGSAGVAGAPREHPYLYFTRKDIPRLKARLTHPAIARMLGRVRATAQNPKGGGRQAKNVLCAGIAYNLTGDRKFADPAIRIMMKIASSRGPWHRPAHHLKYCNLGTAIKTLPLAYGYDMLYDAMTPDQRSRCREALRREVFPDFIRAHARHDRKKRRFTDEKGHREWWTNCYFNWNPWVNGDIGLAALATLDEIPESKKVLQMARESLKYTHDEFNQGDLEDGGWDEGPMYWEGHMGHSIHFYAALEHVLGTDDGFFSLPGVAKTMQYGIDFVAPDGTWVNFSDCNNRLVLDPPSELYFLAARYDKPQFARHIDDNAARWHPLPFGLLWRPTIAKPEPEPRPRARWYRDIHWALLTAKNLFLPFKAGDLGANHGNLDANSLLLWVGGERMLNDPGYGKKGTAEHNCLLVGGKGQQRGSGSRNFGQHTTAFAEILTCGTVGRDSYLVSEASSCYGGALKRYQRHVILSGDGYVIVLDDVECAVSSTVTVNWHTLHAIAADGASGAVIQGQSQQLFLAAAADGPVKTSVRKTRHDKAYVIEADGPRPSWRIVTLLAPGPAGRPRMSVDFGGAEVKVTVTAGGTSRTYPFRRAGGGYRYGGGKLTEAARVPAGRSVKPVPKATRAVRGPKSTARPERPVGPTAEEVSAAQAIAVKLQRAIVEGVRRGEKKTVYIEFGGRSTRARVVAADEKGLTANAQGLEVPIAWSVLSPRRFYGIARKYTADHEALATYCRGMGLAKAAAEEERAR